MENDKLLKLKDLASSATNGPWMRLFGERTIYDRMEDGCRGNSIVRADTAFSAQDAVNLDFIAAANPSTILALIAKVEALEADAERYQWLRHGDNDELVFQRGPVDMSYVYLPRNCKLDEMIDACRAKEKA